MKITARQAAVLEGLHRIQFRVRSGKLCPTLDGEDCDYQLTGLIVKGVVALDERGHPRKIKEPEGVHSLHTHWTRRQ